jgi:hypothetical protein
LTAEETIAVQDSNAISKGRNRGIKAAAGAVGRFFWPASKPGRSSQGRTMRESIGRLRPIPAVARVESTPFARVLGAAMSVAAARSEGIAADDRLQTEAGSWMRKPKSSPPPLAKFAAKADANPTFTSQGTPHHVVCKRWR